MEKNFSEVITINNIDDFVYETQNDDLEQTLKEVSLYHYTSGQVLQSIITNKELWLSKIDFLNDRYEFEYTTNKISKIINNFMSENSTIDLEFKKLTEKLIKEKFELFDVYILSLTHNTDSNLLWSNYADNDGYNIEFSFPFLPLTINKGYKNQGKNVACQPFFIVYDNKKQEKYLEKAIINLYKIFIYCYKSGGNIEKMYSEYGRYSIANLFLYSSFFKDECFSQEDEFRIAIILTPKDQTEIKYDCRYGRGVFTPYIKVPIINEEGKLPINSITIGPKNNLDIAERGLRCFLDSNNMQYIKIKKSKIPYRF